MRHVLKHSSRDSPHSGVTCSKYARVLTRTSVAHPAVYGAQRKCRQSLPVCLSVNPAADGGYDPSNNNGWGGPDLQGPDPLGSVVLIVTQVGNTFVSRTSDVLAAMLPPSAARGAVENSVRGAMALLVLVLLDSVLSAVLSVGAVLLALYFMTQVLGVQLPFFTSPPGQQDGPLTGTSYRNAGNSGQSQTAGSSYSAEQGRSGSSQPGSSQRPLGRDDDPNQEQPHTQQQRQPQGGESMYGRPMNNNRRSPQGPYSNPGSWQQQQNGGSAYSRPRPRQQGDIIDVQQNL